MERLRPRALFYKVQPVRRDLVGREKDLLMLMAHL